MSRRFKRSHTAHYNSSPTFSSAKELIELILNSNYFYPSDNGIPVIPAFYADNESKYVVIVGENGCGKSFFRRLMKEHCKFSKDLIEVSMEGRKEYSEHINQTYNYHHSAFINVNYGSEKSTPTGINSAFAVMDTLEKIKRKMMQHVVFFDDPDIGLSESAAAGMGKYFAEYEKTMSKETVAIVIATHNKTLVKELLPLNPQYLYLGLNKLAPRSLQEWADKPVVARNLNEMIGSSNNRLKLLSSISDKLRDKK